MCGELPALVAALDALDAETSRLDALADVPEATTSILRENGVLDRTYVDTVENVVAVVEALAGRVFRAKVPDADVVLKGRGKIFQRLDDLDDLFARHLDAQIRSALGSEWDELLRTWAARHVFTHCDGIIDAKYLNADRRSSQRVGQRLRITEGDARAAVSRAQKLCRVIAS